MEILEQEFKQNIINHKENYKKARITYFKALALNETIKKLDAESRKEVLKNNTFKISKEWNEKQNKRDIKRKDIITNPINDYLMTNRDFKIYLDLCHKERTKRGLNIPNKDLTSDYKSFELLKTAEKEFINVVFETLPKSLTDGLKDIKNHYSLYKKFLDFSLKLDVEGVL